MVADKIVDAVASASTSLDCFTLSMLMTAYLSCREPQKAIHLFEAAVGVRSDGCAVGDIAIIHGHDHNNGGIMVHNAEAMNEYTTSSLLRAYAMIGDLSAVKRILCAIEGKAGIIVDEKETAAWVGTRATGGTIVADTHCYNVALSAVAKCGPERVPDLMLLFDGMGDRKDLVSYNTVISALADAKMTQEAFGIFASMKKAGLEPNRYTYTALVKVCKLSSEMGTILNDMRKRNVQPNVVTYNAMIKTLCQQSQWHDARELIHEMESVGVAPDSLTYGYLMTSLSKAKKYGSCLALFDTACADPNTMTMTESAQLYTTAIAAASATRNHEKAFELVNRMNSMAIKPDQKTMTALMSACMSSRKWALGVEIYRKIKNPDGLAMRKGLECMCHHGCFSEVLVTLRGQRRRKTSMNGKQIMYVYEHLLRESILQGDFATARAAFTQLLYGNDIPSSNMLQTIVDALDIRVPRKMEQLAFAKEIPESHFDFLLFVLDSLTNRNLPVDGAFYVATLRAGSRMGPLRRKLCALMAEARALMEENECHIRKDRIAACTEPENPLGWEDLLHNYDSYKGRLSSSSNGDGIQLPFLKVRLGKKVRLVLLAEQDLSYSTKRGSGSGGVRPRQ